MIELNIEKYDFNKASLNKIVAETENITADPKSITPQELTMVKDTKNKLVKTRTHIEKELKADREEANAYSKANLKYQHELTDILDKEETRLKTIVADVADYHLKKERRKHLAENKARLATIGDDITIMDKEILAMDPTEFEAYYNQRLANKIASDNAIKEKEAELQKAREEGAKQAEAKAKQDKADMEAKAKQDKADMEAKAKQDKADKLANEKYQAFLKENNYNSLDCKLVESEKVILLYKLVATYKK